MSMKQYITGVHIASGVLMTRTLHKGAILIVEGSFDAQVLKGFIDELQCRIVVAEGKCNALDAMAELERRTVKGILAVVDADFWELAGYPTLSPNVVTTDLHDLETMIIGSPALEKLLRVCANEEQLENFNGTYGKDARTALLDAGLKIGYLRLASEYDGMFLNFQNIIFENFLEQTSLAVDETKLFAEVRRNTRRTIPSDPDLSKKIAALQNAGDDPLQVCCGHDLASILGIALRSAFAMRSRGATILKVVEEDLRLAYEGMYFMGTRLCADIKHWEIANKPYQVLSALSPRY